MTALTVFGMNGNGFTYTACYGAEPDGLVYWTAMFKRQVMFRGRHSGKLAPTKGQTPLQLLARVMDDIEALPVGAR